MVDIEPRNNHPEGLTQAQEQLADMLFTIKTTAPVGKRRENPDGSFEIYKEPRPTSPIDFAQEGEFALRIHQDHPEAPLSPIYVNLRALPDEVVDQIGLVLAEQTANETEKPDYATGIPKAGTVLAEAYAKHSGITYLDVFAKEESTGGGERKILVKEGLIGNGKSLRLVDDLATHGETKIEAAEVARVAGFKVEDVLVVVDREQGAKGELEEANLSLLAAFTLDQLLKYGVRTEKITQERYEEVRDYLTANS